MRPLAGWGIRQDQAASASRLVQCRAQRTDRIAGRARSNWTNPFAARQAARIWVFFSKSISGGRGLLGYAYAT